MSATDEVAGERSHLDQETQQLVEFLAEKWAIPRDEALRLYENTKGDLNV